MEHKSVEDFNMTLEEYQAIGAKINRSLKRKDKVEYWEKVFIFLIHLFIAIIFHGTPMIAFPIVSLFPVLYLHDMFMPIFYYGKFTPPEKYFEFEEYSVLYEWWKEEELEKQRRLEEEKRKENNRKNYDYWSTVNPYEFEREIALLFKKHGFNSRVTKGSGDGGIDIILKKDSEKFIVQCKRHQSKVGPSTVRDLYGAMAGGGYNAGYVVCPSGFSKKAFEFSKGKKITLIGLSRIMEMVNNNSVSFLK
jgi:hypothetical protein